MAALCTGAGLVDVVVTAMTSTTALACDAEDTWQQLLEGGSGIRPLDKWFTREYDSPVRIGGPLREDFDEHLNRVELRRLSYLGKMATVLGRRLWDEAGAPEVDTNRLTVSIGLALGTTEEIAVQYGDWEKRGLRAMSPLAVQMFMPNAPAAAVGLERQAKAGVITPVMGTPPAPGRSPKGGGVWFSARPTSPSAARWKPGSRPSRWPRSPGLACCRPTTTTHRAHAGRSTGTATAWCWPKVAR